MAPTKSNNLAARMGRWSADHWKTATFGWLAFVIVAFGLGGLAGTKSIDPNKPGPGESGSPENVAAADDHAELGTGACELRNLAGDAREHARVNAVVLLAEERLSAQLQQNPAKGLCASRHGSLALQCRLKK